MMLNQLSTVFTKDTWWGLAVWIGVFYFLAWVIHRFARRMAGRIIRVGRFTPRGRKQRPERQATLQGVISSTISMTAFILATLITMGHFVEADTVVWIVGLFTAAFGLAARPLVSDFLAGISILFEDTYAVGEKVEIREVEGVIEEVNLRATRLRAPSGELYIVPNGDVRLVRNFSRGRYSTADIKLKLKAADLEQVLPLLEELGKEAVALLPDLLEPWKVISESGQIGQYTELTLNAKARFGKAVEMRPRLLALVQKRMTETGLELAGD
ncbi:MAG: mechanosensitive ion channel family protein [bacterium]